MRGVILAGGVGNRLRPLTQVTNKHLLPVWDRPMVFYAIENLVKSGIKDILLVTGGRHAGHFLTLLKNGHQLGVNHLEYAYQEGEGGIADALKLAQEFVEGQLCCVMLGDNIYQYTIRQAKQAFERQGSGAMVLSKSLDDKTLDPCRFGVAFHRQTTDGSHYLDKIIEKPKRSQVQGRINRGGYCQVLTGTYFYDPSVFNICNQLKPSKRGELEISDVNRHYLEQQTLTTHNVPGWWSDAGTIESLFHASKQVKLLGANSDQEAVPTL